MPAVGQNAHPVGAHGRRRPGTWQTVLLRRAVAVVPPALLAERSWARRWVSDDGFIYLRIVSQVRAGHGPVFNGGERVEAATSPVWVAFLSVADLLTPVRLEWIAIGLGMCLAVAGVALAIAGSTALVRTREPRGALVPAGALVFVCLSAAWDFSSAGLEGGLVFAWIGACCVLLARWAASEAPALARMAVVCGIGPVLRPDLALMAACFLGALMLGAGRVGWHSRLRTGAAWASVPGSYQVFRMGYYGALVPNTAHAKEAGTTSWGQGGAYMVDLVGTYWLWLPLLALFAGAIISARTGSTRSAGRVRIVVGSFMLAGFSHALFVVGVGGDYMHGRLLLPSLLAVVAPLSVMPLDKAHASAVAVLTVWATVSVAALRPAPGDDAAFRKMVWDDRGYAVATTGVEHPTRADQRVDWPEASRGLEPALYVWTRVATVDGRRVETIEGVRLPAVFASSVGAIGYLAGPDAHVIDALGLGDVFTARLELTGRGYPGHEKPLPVHYAVARLVAPTASYDARDFTTPLLNEWRRWMGPPGGVDLEEITAWLDRRDARVPLEERVEAARHLLRCDGLRDLLAPSRDRLTAGRFLGNLVDSVRFHSARIPWDPDEAVRQLC